MSSPWLGPRPVRECASTPPHSHIQQTSSWHTVLDGIQYIDTLQNKRILISCAFMVPVTYSVHRKCSQCRQETMACKTCWSDPGEHSFPSQTQECNTCASKYSSYNLQLSTSSIICLNKIITIDLRNICLEKHLSGYIML